MELSVIKVGDILMYESVSHLDYFYVYNVNHIDNEFSASGIRDDGLVYHLSYGWNVHRHASEDEKRDFYHYLRKYGKEISLNKGIV